MEIRGTGIGQGVAVGPVVRMADALPEPVDRPSHLDPEREGERARASLSVVAAELANRGAKAGGAAKDVLEAQAMMAEDPSLIDEVTKLLATGKTAERAVYEAFAAYRDLLAGMGGYMAERAADLDDISQRVIAHLLKLPPPGVPNPGHPFVLVARDLAPADTAMLDLDQVLGLVTSDGGPTSHTAILAREKNIVAVVGAADAASLADGDTVVVDAAGDLVVSDPTPEQVAEAEARIAERAALEAAPVTPGALADGTPVPLLANLGSADGAAEAVKLGAEGVGLFRTEFLFLDADTAPSVREQQEHYTRLLTAFAGRKVVVRVLDAGADKPLSFLNDAHEENPALGLRGIRALRHSEVILREQLTALAAADAATDAELWVMAPMIATVEETRYFDRAREGARHPGGRGHGGDAVGRARRRPGARRLRLRLDRHERPHPVHDGRRPAPRHRREPPEPVASRRAPPRGGRRGGRGRTRQARRDLRRGRRRPAARRRARGPRRHEPVDVAVGTRRCPRLPRAVQPG